MRDWMGPWRVHAVNVSTTGEITSSEGRRSRARAVWSLILLTPPVYERFVGVVARRGVRKN
jgi:hypothetical protein